MHTYYWLVGISINIPTTSIFKNSPVLECKAFIITQLDTILVIERSSATCVDNETHIKTFIARSDFHTNDNERPAISRSEDGHLNITVTFHAHSIHGIKVGQGGSKGGDDCVKTAIR